VQHATPLVPMSCRGIVANVGTGRQHSNCGCRARTPTRSPGESSARPVPGNNTGLVSQSATSAARFPEVLSPFVSVAEQIGIPLSSPMVAGRRSKDGGSPRNLIASSQAHLPWISSTVTLARSSDDGRDLACTCYTSTTSRGAYAIAGRIGRVRSSASASTVPRYPQCVRTCGFGQAPIYKNTNRAGPLVVRRPLMMRPRLRRLGDLYYAPANSG